MHPVRVSHLLKLINGKNISKGKSSHLISNVNDISVRRLSTNLSSSSYNPSYIHQIGEQPLKYQTIGQCLEIAANNWPDRPWAISNQENISLTFSQILQEADRLAAGFIECGLQPGDRIGICAPNSTRWVISMMAAARAGLILVTINPAYQESELEYCINKVGMKCLIMPSEFKTQKFCNMIRNLAPELQQSKPGYLTSRRLPDLRVLIMMDDKKIEGAFNFKDVCSMANDTAVQQLSSMQKSIQADSGCNIQFTSGTTGKPKAALLSHFNFVNNSYLIGKRNQLGDKHHKICTMVPLFHAYGVVIVMMAALQHGATMVFPAPSYSPNESLKSINKERCTVIAGTPTMYVDLLNSKRTSGINVETPEIAITGGAPCSPQLFDQIKKELKVSSLKSVFGMTETTAVIFQSLRNESEYQSTETVGHVQEHIEVQVVDENGKPVPFGSAGELWIRGYCNMLGYWGEHQKTLETIGPDKWLKTGDKFILQEDGYGRVIGRLKDMIIRGGENIYPKEIEDFLNTHPDVLETQVFGVSDERMGEEICASLRLKENGKLDYDGMKSYCQGKMAHYKIPRYLKIVDNFPKTASGKIQKFKLREMFENGTL